MQQTTNVAFENFIPDSATLMNLESNMQKILGSSPSDSLVKIMLRKKDVLVYEAEIKVISRSQSFLSKVSGFVPAETLNKGIISIYEQLRIWQHQKRA